MKHSVIAMVKHPGTVEISGIKKPVTLPEGCTGILFCFESKKAARKYLGKNTPLARIEEEHEAIDNKNRRKL